MRQTQTDIDVDYDAPVERWEPVASSSRPTNFVPAATGKPEMPTQLWQPVTSGDMDVWRPSESIREETSAVDRSVGLLIRQLPLSIVWIVLAVTAALVAWAVIPAWWALVFGLGVFGVLSAGSFILFDRQERDYSGAGLERHRINQAAGLKRLELKQAHELKRAALDAYLDHLSRKDGKP
jgi:hypothetical protein